MILWAGRSDVPWFPEHHVTEQIPTAVAYAKRFTDLWLVLGVTTKINGVENRGSPNYAAVVAHNELMAATYGNRYLDVRRLLVYHALDMLGLKNDQDDMADSANDIIPRSLLIGDRTQLTSVGEYAVAEFVGHDIRMPTPCSVAGIDW